MLVECCLAHMNAHAQKAKEALLMKLAELYSKSEVSRCGCIIHNCEVFHLYFCSSEVKVPAQIHVNNSSDTLSWMTAVRNSQHRFLFLCSTIRHSERTKQTDEREESLVFLPILTCSKHSFKRAVNEYFSVTRREKIWV